jgi:hypothetical protein
MEFAMHVRLLMIAAVGSTLGTAAPADPPKPAVQNASQPASRPAPVMLASAEPVRTPSPSDQATTPAKPHRAARVTSCRCGGQTEEQR